MDPTTIGCIIAVFLAIGYLCWAITHRGHHHHPTHTKQQQAAERAGHPSNKGGNE